MPTQSQPMAALNTRHKAAVLADGTSVPLTPTQYALVERLWRAKQPIGLSPAEKCHTVKILRRKGMPIINRYGWGYILERVTA